MLEKRLVLVSGKGGVGKSVVSAGLALLAQRRGLRVLAMEMGAPGGLSAHFGTGPLEFEPMELRPGLHAMQMVRSDALLEYLSIQLGMRGLNRFGPLARAFDALATTAPGIREIITIGKAIWEVREDRWDIVIADAPPTGQIGSYVRAPVTISELVPAGRIRVQAEVMREILHDPSLTELILVSLPEELPVTETEETLTWLGKEDLVPSPTVIANRVLDQLTDPDTPPGPVGDAARLHRSLWAEQQEWLERLCPVQRLPYLHGLFTPGEVAARIADEFEVTA
ncbi:MAG TPA: ArsA family ATPase [Acidimicrobiia bacterium]|nr:ArsA family ATPase [Acidimicrobiia bacterium]